MHIGVFIRLLSLLILLSVQAAQATEQKRTDPIGSADNGKPIEITARTSLEWLREKKQYIARDDVKVQQGDMAITADLLEADYRETKGSDFDIYRLTATGNVHLTSADSTAQGDKAVYEVDKGVATLTGKNLKLTSPEQTVTARDRFEYFANEGRLNAVGDARAVRGEDIITAEKISAIFKEDPKTGSRELSRLEAVGDVVITTPAEKLRGERGSYDARTTIARLDGNVKIERGPNQLEGNSADVNMTTNVSRMHGAGQDGKASDGGRVRGVFYPGTQKGDKQKPTQEPDQSADRAKP